MAAFSPPIMASELMRILAPATGLPAASRTIPASAEVVAVWAITATGHATSASTSALNLEEPEFLAITPPKVERCWIGDQKVMLCSKVSQVFFHRCERFIHTGWNEGSGAGSF